MMLVGKRSTEGVASRHLRDPSNDIPLSLELGTFCSAGTAIDLHLFFDLHSYAIIYSWMLLDTSGHRFA
jgi:hypothetical protein